MSSSSSTAAPPTKLSHQLHKKHKATVSSPATRIFTFLCVPILSVTWRLFGQGNLVRDEYRVVVLALLATGMAYFRKPLVEWWNAADTLRFLLAGAVAGIVSRTAVSPLEVLATLQMVQGQQQQSPGDASTTSLLGQLLALYQSEGYRGFFKGNFANCLKVAPSRGIQMFCFESLKQRLLAYKKSKRETNHTTTPTLSPLERLIAGGLAGMAATMVIYPIEVLKTMLTLYPHEYPSIVDAFWGVVREVGYVGLYAGLAPTLLAMFPYVGVEFMMYESCKLSAQEWWSNRRQRTCNNKKEKQPQPSSLSASFPHPLPTSISLALGALAGATAQTSAHPLDVLRKRLQVQGLHGNPVLYANVWQAFHGVWTKEGWKALYHGLGAACVATIPGTAISYYVYEGMKHVLGLESV